MTTPELVPKGTDDDARDDESRHGPEYERRSRRPATRRSVRRWELGFFVRKIVNGWLAYYKKFPPGSEPETPGPAGELATRAMSTSPGERSAQGEDALVGPVQPYSGHVKGSDDSGPVGETSVETGFFLRSTTDTTDEESDAS